MAAIDFARNYLCLFVAYLLEGRLSSFQTALYLHKSSICLSLTEMVPRLQPASGSNRGLIWAHSKYFQMRCILLVCDTDTPDAVPHSTAACQLLCCFICSAGGWKLPADTHPPSRTWMWLWRRQDTCVHPQCPAGLTTGCLCLLPRAIKGKQSFSSVVHPTQRTSN